MVKSSTWSAGDKNNEVVSILTGDLYGGYPFSLAVFREAPLVVYRRGLSVIKSIPARNSKDGLALPTII
jgi:hypothetical protein